MTQPVTQLETQALNFKLSYDMKKLPLYKPESKLALIILIFTTVTVMVYVTHIDQDWLNFFFCCEHELMMNQ